MWHTCNDLLPTKKKKKKKKTYLEGKLWRMSIVLVVVENLNQDFMLFGTVQQLKICGEGAF
jgi:hypothetical protein